MNRIGAVLAAMGLAVGAGAKEAEKAPDRPTIEVVFVLDTTGSMGGLLEGAKTKAWSIVNEMAKGKPEPRIKMGLVAYRDRGDSYVTQVEPLSSNLDAVYEKLLALQPGGGGDGPEDVLSGLNDAVSKAGWSVKASKGKVMRVIYLVGDAPAHEDYKDVPPLKTTLEAAVKKGIRVHAIRCGGDTRTGEQWAEIARFGEGKYFTIGHDGGVTVVETPFDRDIASLHAKLESTTMAFGDGAAEARASMAFGAKMLAAAPAAASADRAMFKAKEGFRREADLLAAVDGGSVKLDEVKEADLPASMRGKDAAGKKAELEKVRSERKKLEKELAALSQKRAAHLKAAADKGPKDSFDSKVMEAIREDAKKAGISY